MKAVLLCRNGKKKNRDVYHHDLRLGLISRWSDCAMVLGKLPVPGRPTISMIVGQGPIALAVGAGGGWFGHFYSRLSFLSSFSLSLGDGPI